LRQWTRAPTWKGPRAFNGGGARETGFEFYKSWVSDTMPGMIVVSFLHPTPFFDDSYAVNSANDGPYGDAVMNELIPYVESHFRVIRKPYARVLTGGSTGGWESLALQVYHPEFFGERGRSTPIQSTFAVTSPSTFTLTRTPSSCPTPRPEHPSE
jgi:hypothetical protein